MIIMFKPYGLLLGHGLHYLIGVSTPKMAIHIFNKEKTPKKLKKK